MGSRTAAGARLSWWDRSRGACAPRSLSGLRRPRFIAMSEAAVATTPATPGGRGGLAISGWWVIPLVLAAAFFGVLIGIFLTVVSVILPRSRELARHEDAS